MLPPSLVLVPLPQLTFPSRTPRRGEGKEEAENEKQLKQGNQLIDSAVESTDQLVGARFDISAANGWSFSNS